jgi:hypothetical protein
MTTRATSRTSTTCSERRRARARVQGQRVCAQVGRRLTTKRFAGERRQGASAGEREAYVKRRPQMQRPAVERATPDQTAVGCWM